MEKLIEVFKLVKPETDIEDILKSKDLYGQGIIDSIDIINIIEDINDMFDIEIGAADFNRKDFLTAESIWVMIQRNGGK